MIEVSYDGKWPCACSGTLIIKENGKEIYNKQYCCSSTGSVWFDDDWDAHINEGNLEWEDSNSFSEDVVNAVYDVLNNVRVCCGGCI